MFAYSDCNIFYAVALCRETSGILPNIQLQVTKTIYTCIHACTCVCVCAYNKFDVCCLPSSKVKKKIMHHLGTYQRLGLEIKHHFLSIAMSQASVRQAKLQI